ncbi:MAG: tetratricopeptide repeat protein, partial [Cyclobacteriaceae bacterium]
MNWRKFSSILLLSILSHQVNSQNILDDYKHSDSLSRYYEYKDLEKSMDYQLKALALAVEINDKSLLFEAMTNYAGLLSETGQFEESVKKWEETFTYAQNRGDSALIYKGIAIPYLDKGDTDLALKNLLKALELVEDDDQLRIRILTELGFAHRGIHEYEKALDYFKQIVTLKKKLGINNYYREHMNIGLAYLDFDLYDSAIHHFNLSYDGMDKENEVYGIGLYYTNMGCALTDSKRFEEALPYSKKAVIYKEKLGNPTRLANSYNL